MRDIEGFERRLRQRLAELERRIHKVEDELDQPHSVDTGERAVETEGDEVLEGLGSAGLAEMRMIHAALERIRSGEYGTCVACGEPIPVKRLELVPHAARCRNCA